MPETPDHRHNAVDAIIALHQTKVHAPHDSLVPRLLQQGFCAVSEAILATTQSQPERALRVSEPPTINRLGEFVPVEAWTEFSIKAFADEGGQGFAVWSATLERNLFDAGDQPDGVDTSPAHPLSLYEAITLRDQLIRDYAREIH